MLNRVWHFSSAKQSQFQVGYSVFDCSGVRDSWVLGIEGIGYWPVFRRPCIATFFTKRSQFQFGPSVFRRSGIRGQVSAKQTQFEPLPGDSGILHLRNKANLSKIGEALGAEWRSDGSPRNSLPDACQIRP